MTKPKRLWQNEMIKGYDLSAETVWMNLSAEVISYRQHDDGEYVTFKSEAARNQYSCPTKKVIKKKA